ncbi:MAG TPA: hypothetical protein VMS55_08065 [Myxococcota bacterium]|nr:hypothetical protein [Myxococcota bacterium]
MPDTAFRASLRLLGTRRFGTFWFASLASGGWIAAIGHMRPRQRGHSSTSTANTR